MSKNDGNLMDRRHLTSILMDAKRNRAISFEEIAKAVGRHKVWTAAAMYGQATMATDEAKKLLQCLGLPLEKEWLDLLCAVRCKRPFLSILCSTAFMKYCKSMACH